MNNKSAFTIIEILISTSLFMSLMGIVAFSFQRLNEGGRYAQKIVEMHHRSDSIIRLLEDDMRTLQQTTAVRLDLKSNPKTFTFMRQINSCIETESGQNDLINGISGLGEEEIYRTDLVWVKLSWGDGRLSRAASRPHYIQETWSGDNTFTDNTKQYLKTVNFQNVGSNFCGVHRNGLPPTPQRRFVCFYGNGNWKSVSSDGSVSARPGDQIRIYKKISASDYNADNCLFFDELTSPWRVTNDYSHWYTTFRVGNDQILSDKAFAVCNEDSLTFNKDRLNLEGSDDIEGPDEYFYPDQTRTMFTGVEYMTMKWFKRDGTEIDISDDDDTINDGSDSIDINGIDSTGSGDGIFKRPATLRVSFLIHSIDQNEIDESDYDVDGDTDEYLVQAVRDQVTSEGHSIRQDEIDSFKMHCRNLGASTLLISYAIKLSL